jgi:hypothetical protein
MINGVFNSKENPVACDKGTVITASFFLAFSWVAFMVTVCSFFVKYGMGSRREIAYHMDKISREEEMNRSAT